MSKIIVFPLRKVEFPDLARGIQPPEGLIREDWHEHPNGGGWVQKTATVSTTAYVGPMAIISGAARILDRAQIIDEAMVTGFAVVAGDALIYGNAWIAGHAKIFGTARIGGSTQVAGTAVIFTGEVNGGFTQILPRNRRTHPEQLRLAV